ncbi:CidA/LrgA family protein [Crenobacter caeni]|uniref:CidA/LrgA family protein n=1 Tax=Crenobacter caeni TaxID=2705474 RepID=A0A6B2KW51_9NEIS|nr:CidA/LrgA family protein [Crenobacter caeni]NDV14249.1 CidA/LrgA family protein [Crenobacter caeni]
MLEAVIWLLGYQLAGEFIVRCFGWPLPGAVVGMLLLLLTLLARRSVPEGLQHSVPTLLGHLSLLFIPAGVGVLAWWPQLLDAGWRLALVLLLSTLLPLLGTAYLLRALLARKEAAR